MQLDTIGYRYTTEELSVLMSVQGYDAIPALPCISRPDREQFARGMESLEDNDILSNVSGKILLDRIHAFLINRLCECEHYVSVSENSKHLVMGVCGQIAMLVTTRDSERWVMRIAPDPDSLREEFEHAVRRMFPDACTIRTAAGGKVTEQQISDQGGPEAEIQSMWAMIRQRENLFG